MTEIKERKLCSQERREEGSVFLFGDRRVYEQNYGLSSVGSVLDSVRGF